MPSWAGVTEDWRSRLARSPAGTRHTQIQQSEVAARAEDTGDHQSDPATRRHTDHVGYSPYRKFTARTGDYVMVVAAVLIGAELVIWAFLA